VNIHEYQAKALLRRDGIETPPGRTAVSPEHGPYLFDDILDAFAVVGGPSEIASQIKSRYGDIVDRTSAAYANIPDADRRKIIKDLTG